LTGRHVTLQSFYSDLGCLLAWLLAPSQLGEIRGASRLHAIRSLSLIGIELLSVVGRPPHPIITIVCIVQVCATREIIIMNNHIGESVLLSAPLLH
jgi:hypothetical protein